MAATNAQPTAFHSFPAGFETDERFVREALAEWNRDHGTSIKFSELSALEQSTVLLLANKLKRAEAEMALKYVPHGELRPKQAIETARRWGKGQATMEEVRNASASASVARKDSLTKSAEIVRSMLTVPSKESQGMEARP